MAVKQLLFFIFLLPLGFSEEIGSGYVYSYDQEPVPFASVVNLRTETWSITDKSGFFQLPMGTLSGDSLKIDRIGFSTSHQLITGKSPYVITLSNEVITFDPVNTVGEKPIANSGFTKVTLLEIDGFSRNNALYRLPGTMIRSYGGLAGITTVSMDGGQAVHTKVLLDGIDLTNAQNGLTDLSDIPLTLMQNVYLSRSPNIHYGSGSFDGVVQIRSLFNQSFIHFGIGSFGYLNSSGSFSHATANTNFQLQIGQTSSNGNYSFKQNGATNSRLNNDYEQRFISGHYQRHTSSNRILKGSILAVDHNRGVAGALSWPSPKARRKNNLLLAGFESIQILEKGYLRLQAFQRTSDEEFRDTDMGTDSQHKVGSSEIKIHGQYQLTRLIGMDGFSTIKFESIESTDTGKRERDIKTLGFQVLAHPINSFIIKPGLRSDIIDTTNVITPDVEITLDLETIGKFSIIIGTGFHIPSFNDLYWPSDPHNKGNPDLVTENSEFHIIRWNNILAEKLDYTIEYRERQSDNLIVWATDENNIWKPQNLDKTDRKNLIISASIPASSSGFTLSGSITRTVTKNLNTGKALQYVPESAANITLNYALGDIQIELQNKYTGERSYQGYGDNYEILDKILEPFLNVNAGAHFAVPAFNESLQFHLIAENILNKNTAFFPDYPEPGHSIKVGMTVKF